MTTVTTRGSQIEVKNIAISAALKAISFDHAVNHYRFRTRNGTAFRIYTINDDGDNVEYYGVPAPAATATPAEFRADVTGQEKETTVCWVRTESGTDTLECFGIF
jgi:hypothetical protein